MELRGRKAWVIGASSGIGAAVAEELLARGCIVTISARNESALQAVAAGRMRVLALDMTDRAALLEEAARLKDEGGGLDLVIIAAGYWQQMPFQEFDFDTFARHIDINVMGMANVIAAVLPLLQEQHSGNLIGISSVAGYRGMPGAQGYGASKAAQLNLLESLRVGLHGSGVLVQTVAPGFVRTPMTASNDFPMPFIIDADRAARYIADGIEKGKPEIVFPPSMTIVMKMARIVPQRLWMRLMAPRAKRERT